jgi:hypothetical protein
MTTLPIAAVDLLRLLDADRVRAMEEVKRRVDEGSVAARARAEASATPLETDVNPQRAGEVDAALASDLAAAQQQGEQELSSLVAEAPEDFRDEFAMIRETLNADWPRAFLSAIPVVPAALDATAEAAVNQS